MGSNFNIFDPSQWANVTGFGVMVAGAVITLVGVAAKFVGSALWGDWLDETHGRGSIDDLWES